MCNSNEMDKSFVENYLIANGKYFPKSKLNKIGNILEISGASKYTITKRYFNPLTTTIIFWIFYPIQLFDRIILRDWFWGIIKLITPLILGYLLSIHGRGLYLGVYTLEAKICIILFLFWGIWTIVDGFTIYYRTKMANYKAFLRALNMDESKYDERIIKVKEHAANAQNLSEEMTEWKKINPNTSLNEFYKRKK